MSPAHWVLAGWVVRPRHSGVPVAAVPLRRETGVYYGLERVGRLEKFPLEDDPRTIAERVVKPCRSRDQLVLVPVDGVEFVDEDGIWFEFDPRSAVEPWSWFEVGVGYRGR